jgi:hypothetical protein
VLTREETLRLIESQEAINEKRLKTTPKPDAAFDACDKAFDELPHPWASPWGISQFLAAVSYVREHSSFSLTGLLQADAFNSGDVPAHYAVAYTAMEFLAGRASASLVASWKRVIAQRDYALGGTDASAIDKAYRSFLEEWAAKWWENPHGDALWRKAVACQTQCLNAGSLLNAYSAAWLMIAYQPRSPLGYVYLGDVFDGIRQPFIALEDYTEASKWVETSKFSEVLVRARIADAWEKLGDISKARQGYIECANMAYPPILTITILRGKLKAEYYALTEGDGSWATDSSLRRIDRYVGMLQSADAVRELKTHCSGGHDLPCFSALMQKRYAEVSERMRSELAASKTR